MPTPSETAVVSTSPMGESLPSRASFASCPPEEERETRSVVDSQDGSDTGDTDVLLDEEHTTSAATTPEPETISESISRDKLDGIDDHGVALADRVSSRRSLDAPTEGETHLAHNLNDAASSTSSSPSSASSLLSPSPQYLYYPQDRNRQSPYATSSFLRPGSKFRGTQQSDRQVYDVQVEIKDVNMAESFLCGYLRIQGLTDDHPTLTTFFEGEIIGPKHLFKTTHASWGSNEKVDLQHWARFPAWRPLAKSAKSPNFTLKNYQQREHLFMRWKEYFLVPDHRVKTITGASFEGFYYICFNQCTGSVSGIYFHAKSEKYQQLELQHVEHQGCVAAMEFR